MLKYIEFYLFGKVCMKNYNRGRYIDNLALSKELEIYRKNNFTTKSKHALDLGITHMTYNRICKSGYKVNPGTLARLKKAGIEVIVVE